MTLSASTLAGYYDRLHQKIQNSDRIFDRSWDCNDLRSCDVIQWVGNQFTLSDPKKDVVNLTFEPFIERLILLSIDELKRLLCGLGALAMPCHLRHCIDGTSVRNLRMAVGPHAFDLLMRRSDLHEAKSVIFEWDADSLCRDGLAQIVACASPALAVTINFLKLSLPKHLSTKQSRLESSDVRLPMSQLKALFPELRWLFG